jgi:hypothetical protein
MKIGDFVPRKDHAELAGINFDHGRLFVFRDVNASRFLVGVQYDESMVAEEDAVEVVGTFAYTNLPTLVLRHGDDVYHEALRFAVEWIVRYGHMLADARR